MHPLRVVHDLRPALPWTIYSLPIAIENDGAAPAVQERRFAVQWDEDNDERVLAAILGVYFRRPQTLSNLYAVGEHKGRLSIWASGYLPADQIAWQSAAAGPAIQDEWRVDGIENAFSETVRAGGRQLPVDGQVLRTFEPDHDQLNWLIKLFELGPTGPRIPF
jgi:hypothetical protein